ncbi:hypothetical protein R50072_32370 [Simiduia litorea]|uniref:antibiotic biosynthesis monooxygenase family protein n=1 Tax=Simiduia litorea TaxID=1435348 RepID=UPI0036F1E929
MSELHVINAILVPAGMEAEAEQVRAEYVKYFSKQTGFVSSTFYKSVKTEADGSSKYVNTVVWASQQDFERVVNLGFDNAEGENRDGMRVLGKGFPEPITVSPGQYHIISQS